MTKADELALLRETMKRLGPDSYCGPWLESELPAIEADMRNDFPVAASISSARAECDRILAAANAKAADIMAAAERAARTQDRQLSAERERAAMTLRNAIRALGVSI